MIHLMKKKHAYQMNRRTGLSLLAVFFCSLAAPAQTTIHTEDAGAVFSIRATHLLGFENAKNNCAGTLIIQHDLVQFQQNDEAPVQVEIASVRDVLLGEESKQVGWHANGIGQSCCSLRGWSSRQPRRP